jgi:predicted nucleic acid-binding protein
VGVVLDANALVTAERRGQTVPEILSQFRTAWGDTEIVLSVVTIVELAHGIQRAKSLAQRERREVFLEELLATLTVYPSP